MAERDPGDSADAIFDVGSTKIEPFAPESEERAESLRRALRRSKGFSLHVVIADGTARREILRRLQAWSGTGGVPQLYFFDEGQIGANAVERWIAEAWDKEPLEGVVLSDGDALIANESALSALNVARDRLGHLVQGPFVVVLSPRSEAEMATIAPDLFDVRGGTWEFAAAPASERAVERSLRTLFDKPWPEISKSDLQAAAASLRALGQADPGPPPGALANAWIKLGETFFLAGEFGEAVAAAEEAERRARSVGYTVGVGHALSLKAHALAESGHPKDVERSLRDALDRFREAGDIRNQALGLFQLAEILIRTGRFDEAHAELKAALQIFHGISEELLSAMTRGRMADIYQIRGQLDEALRIHREEELPIYVKHGNDLLQAVTWNKIAHIQKRRGLYDEALRIYKDETLPIYEKRNDIRGRAFVWGEIADILRFRGQFEDAIQIYTQKVLPAFEALGHLRNRIGILARIAEIHWLSGRLDEAMRILLEEVLPAHEKLNSIREIVVCQMNLAKLHLARNKPGDREQAAELLRQARASAERLRIPELESIKALQVQAGLGDPEESQSYKKD